jgi:hypothetical protein
MATPMTQIISALICESMWGDQASFACRKSVATLLILALHL